MGKSLLPIEPSEWSNVIERIGILNTLLLIFALGFGLSFVFRGPAYLHGINAIINTVLKHRREMKRIPTKAKQKQENLRVAIETRKRKDKREARSQKR
jgi:hypothetical protein